MEYEVVDKNEGTTIGSSWEAMCEQRKEEIMKDATMENEIQIQ